MSSGSELGHGRHGKRSASRRQGDDAEGNEAATPQSTTHEEETATKKQRVEGQSESAAADNNAIEQDTAISSEELSALPRPEHKNSATANDNESSIKSDAFLAERAVVEEGAFEQAAAAGGAEAQRLCDDSTSQDISGISPDRNDLGRTTNAEEKSPIMHPAVDDGDGHGVDEGFEGDQRDGREGDGNEEVGEGGFESEGSNEEESYQSQSELSESEGSASNQGTHRSHPKLKMSVALIIFPHLTFLDLNKV